MYSIYDWFLFTIIDVHDISSNKVNDLMKYNKHYFGLMYLSLYIFVIKYYTYEINGNTTIILSLQWKILKLWKIRMKYLYFCILSQGKFTVLTKCVVWDSTFNLLLDIFAEFYFQMTI